MQPRPRLLGRHGSNWPCFTRAAAPAEDGDSGKRSFCFFQFLCFATTPLRPARVNIFNLLFPDQQMSPYGIIHELLPNQVHLRKAISPSLATKRGVEVMEVRGR